MVRGFRDFREAAPEVNRTTASARAIQEIFFFFLAEVPFALSRVRVPGARAMIWRRSDGRKFDEFLYDPNDELAKARAAFGEK